MDPSIFGIIPENRDGISTNVGEKNYSIAQQLCQKQSNMATVTAMTLDNMTQISWKNTNGNDITFRLESDITIGTGELCIKSHHVVENNTDYSSMTPEIHFFIEPDDEGSNSIHIDECVTVTMPDIHQAVEVLLIIKEGDEVKRSETYRENPAEVMRPTKKTLGRN